MNATEPIVKVGLIEDANEVALRLDGAWRDALGERLSPGDYRVHRAGAGVVLAGPDSRSGGRLELVPENPQAPDAASFSLEATIGIAFHWQRREVQTFRGGLDLRPGAGAGLAVINRVPLETYLASVIGSEMRAGAPPALARAHAIISRSWLLAQLAARDRSAAPAPPAAIERGEIRTWTDRQAHADFDVCADDHCQRYQGIGRLRSPAAAAAVAATRGQVLIHGGQPCDARFSKCCGGVTEDFRSAWSDTPVPYLVPVRDAADRRLPDPPLSDEAALRRFIEQPPAGYCNCGDEELLAAVLNDYDRETRDFFRWRVRLDAAAAGALVRRKSGVDLGRLTALEPLQRGLSGRLLRLRLVGEAGSLVVGKELAIRRALSESHLFSSAFAIDTEGPAGRPDAFVLRGAGWGHGVGLCQIGAAVMAAAGHDHRAILAHYYPQTVIEQGYD